MRTVYFNYRQEGTDEEWRKFLLEMPPDHLISNLGIGGYDARNFAFGHVVQVPITSSDIDQYNPIFMDRAITADDWRYGPTYTILHFVRDTLVFMENNVTIEVPLWRKA